jgi:hypothetical protein
VGRKPRCGINAASSLNGTAPGLSRDLRLFSTPGIPVQEMADLTLPSWERLKSSAGENIDAATPRARRDFRATAPSRFRDVYCPIRPGRIHLAQFLRYHAQFFRQARPEIGGFMSDQQKGLFVAG